MVSCLRTFRCCANGWRQCRGTRILLTNGVSHRFTHSNTDFDTCAWTGAAGHARIDVRMEASPVPLVSGSRLSGAGGAAFLTTAASLRGKTAGSAGPEFDRETQAPLIWMNLHKPRAGSVDDAPLVSFVSFATQRSASLAR